MHHFYLGGVLGGDPVVLSLVVDQLHLSRVRKLDHGADGHLKLPARRVVQPHMVALLEMKESFGSCHPSILLQLSSLEPNLSLEAEAMPIPTPGYSAARHSSTGTAQKIGGRGWS